MSNVHSHVHGGATGQPGAHDHGGDHGHAGAHDQRNPAEDPAAFWERRYAGADRVWSGRVNQTLAEIVADWAPGRSLDLGSGEGGDVLWLAERGWDATGIELSTTAVERARAVAAERGVVSARFVAADLAEWVDRPASIDGGAELFDLVTASFLQSPVELPRERILRAAAERVASGGHLVLVSHAAPPAWASDHPGDFPSPVGELAMLALDADEWVVEVAEVRTRDVVAPDGAASSLDDTVIVARRRY